MRSWVRWPGGQDDLILLSAGPLAAILLGVALVPFRGRTPAANFTFLFMALTILVAEFGGRAAAVATALFSALSLNFFLTQPYLRFTIVPPDEIVAFIGLAACGLLAAAFGSRHGRRVADSRAARDQVRLLHALLRLARSGRHPRARAGPASGVGAVRSALEGAGPAR